MRALSALEANGLVVGAVAIVALLTVVLVRAELIGDTWLLLVGGREVGRASCRERVLTDV